MNNQIVQDAKTRRREVRDLCEKVLEYSYNRSHASTLRRIATAIESMERLERIDKCVGLEQIKESLHKAIHEEDIRGIEYNYGELKLVLSAKKTEKKLAEAVRILEFCAK